MLKLESPKEVYQEYLKHFGLQGGRRVVYEYFRDNYFEPIPKMNREDVIKEYKKLIPGRVYTYNYDPLYPDNLSFLDKRPIILCIKEDINKNTKNHVHLGINFNFVPNKVRLNLLEVLFKSFEKLIMQDANRRIKDRQGRVTPIFKPNFDYYGVLEYLWNTVAKSGFKFALRNYVFSQMDNVKMVDYDLWGLITFLESKDITGASFGQIHKLYWTQKNKDLGNPKYKGHSR